MSFAKRYLEITNEIAKLEKERKQLRTYFIGVMGGSEVIELEGVLLMLEPRKRVLIDKDKLLLERGQAFVDSYTKITKYSELRCKQLVK